MAMEDKDYQEYLKSFVDTHQDELRYIPKMRGIKDFDFVDETSVKNKVGGQATKWCVRANKMYFRDLIKEIKNNSNSSYETCYTKNEIEQGNIPEYFSVVIKEPESECSIDADVFGSRILNYFGVPVAYNRRIDKAYPNYSSDKYLMSVDFLRPNETFVELSEVISFGEGMEIKWFARKGMDRVIECIDFYLDKYLRERNIKFNEGDIAKYNSYFISSLLTRVYLMNDNDFRNGNIGIILNKKEKSFRPAPNFDLEKCFSFKEDGLKFNLVADIYKKFPNEYADFIYRTYQFVVDDGTGESDCSKLAKKSIKNSDHAVEFINNIYKNASQILKTAEELVKHLDRVEAENEQVEASANLQNSKTQPVERGKESDK